MMLSSDVVSMSDVEVSEPNATLENYIVLVILV
jgi:hypothetical protein